MDFFLDDFDMINDDLDKFRDRCDLDFDPNFPPMSRERANTWHGPPRGASKDEGVAGRHSTADETLLDSAARVGALAAVSRDQAHGSGPGTARKATARRNAWGNMSYADLIAKAIESTPDKRLTLAEIYAWLVENVPFFKDKGDTSSSAGWKNSIRHNLSLHNRFVRVPNEGAGKSSWWVVNPDKGPCKAPRRRAATMDNSKGISQKRGRQRRSEAAATVSSTNKSSVDFDSSPPNYFPLSPEFRGRVGSNASSVGRLSPIPATFEVDLDPTTTPPGTAFLQWNNPAVATDKLSDCLSGILLDDMKPTSIPHLATDPIFLQTGLNNVDFPLNFLPSSQYATYDAPIGAFNTLVHKNEAFSMSPLGNLNNLPNKSTLCVGGNTSGNCGYSSTGLQLNLQSQLYKTPSVNDLPNTHTQLQLCTSPLTLGEIKPSFPTAFGSNTSNYLLTAVPMSRQEFPKLAEGPKQSGSGWSEMKKKPLDTEPQPRQRSFTFSSGKLDQHSLRQLLIAKPFLRSDILKLLQLKRQQLFSAEQTQSNSSGLAGQATSSVQPQPSEYPEQTHHSMLEQLMSGKLVEKTSDVVPQLSNTSDEMETEMDITPGNLPSSQAVFVNEPADLPSDLDLNYLNSESTADIDCNIDQVIQHELTFGDGLDFTFDPIQPNWNNSSTNGNGDSLTNFLS